jgi:hypothetical protein
MNEILGNARIVSPLLKGVKYCGLLHCQIADLLEGMGT